jgi:hypothetical protein
MATGHGSHSQHRYRLQFDEEHFWHLGDDLVVRQPGRQGHSELVRRGDDLVCRWRRIGDHSVFKSP